MMYWDLCLVHSLPQIFVHGIQLYVKNLMWPHIFIPSKDFKFPKTNHFLLHGCILVCPPQGWCHYSGRWATKLKCNQVFIPGTETLMLLKSLWMEWIEVTAPCRSHSCLKNNPCLCYSPSENWAYCLPCLLFVGNKKTAKSFIYKPFTYWPDAIVSVDMLIQEMVFILNVCWNTLF